MRPERPAASGAGIICAMLTRGEEYKLQTA
ncbi:hypothetical protein M529_05375 [Sphingobium ummariense RL-3]|uniref:Uncharacterized protein n=1 Tax=Sphingobium ummariense RL-3 TaxID=1346791 RepID=T0J5J2_9SPHN|nr:hypothetical protein M529_05375 [Sphingobium ummariense RL-3]